MTPNTRSVSSLAHDNCCGPYVQRQTTFCSHQPDHLRMPEQKDGLVVITEILKTSLEPEGPPASPDFDLPVLEDGGLIFPLRLNFQLHVECSLSEIDGFREANVVILVFPASLHRRPRL